MSTSKCKVLRFIHADGAQLQENGSGLLVCSAQRTYVLAHISSVYRNSKPGIAFVSVFGNHYYGRRMQIYVSNNLTTIASL